MIASYSSRSRSASFGVSCNSVASSGVLTKPIVIRSSADHLDSSRGSLSASISTLPPWALAIVTSIPALGQLMVRMRQLGSPESDRPPEGGRRGGVGDDNQHLLRLRRQPVDTHVMIGNGSTVTGSGWTRPFGHHCSRMQTVRSGTSGYFLSDHKQCLLPRTHRVHSRIRDPPARPGVASTAHVRRGGSTTQLHASCRRPRHGSAGGEPADQGARTFTRSDAVAAHAAKC